MIALAALALLAASAAHASGLLIAEGGFGGMLEIVEHDVQVTVNNGVAVTEVTQVFQNLEDRQVEALYTFPVPKGASVANFSMWINGKEMIGEVVEKKRAREIYNSYKQKRRDPGLLEQTDHKTFEMRIFPIGPRARQKVRISYYQELDVDHNWATYVYPLATTTRRGADARVRDTFAVRFDVKSEVPVVEMDSPSHGKGFVVARHSEHYWQASLEAAEGDLNRDVVLAYRIARPRTGVDVICSKRRSEDGYFALTLTAGEELERLNKAMDYVFVLDVSGSMADDGKLRISRRSIGAFIDTLGPEDRFEVITFNVAPTTLFNRLQKADANARARAGQFLESREARGGTVLNPAMQTAYRYRDPDRQLNVVVLSDGMTEQREWTALFRILRKRPANARVFCIGVGNDVDRRLLEQVAHDAGGLTAFLSRGGDFARQAKAFRRKLEHPAATGVRISFEGGGVYDLEPKALGNLFHGSPLRLYGRYRQPGPVEAVVEAEVAGRTVQTTATLQLPEKDDDNPEIERMWAWHKVDRLLKEADRAGQRAPSLLDEIVRLGEGYSIATEYTSFIVLENNAEYQRWQIDRRNALRIERDRAKRERLRRKLDAVQLAAASELGPVATQPADRGTRAAPAARPTPRPASSGRRGFDIRFGGGGGGGAVDPVTALIAVALAGGALAARHRWGRERADR
jgi:Ca-activated chloride channel family protein